MPRRLVRLSAFLAVLAAAPVGAEQASLYYFDMPPFTYQQDGELAGAIAALAHSVTADLGIATRSEPMPLRRLEFEARNRPIIVAAITRNARREDSYQWIGRICTEAFVMASRTPNAVIDSLDDARKLKSIAVAAGANNEVFLRDHGFTNLDVAATIQLEARRLAEGHDDAWFAPRAGVIHAWVAAGYDPSQLRFGAPIAPMQIWMAASPKVPAALVETLRARFAERARSAPLAGEAGCTGD
ncbi:MAG TPA: transporter substrate-binding domain-containing protein [Magnetospirillaceae bacterium]|nr:transporter substrate-binding domain-containing protein [Magnetospirillaceae bacterium]